MGTFPQDVRNSVRLLLKSPGFAIIEIVTLAPGIGSIAITNPRSTPLSFR
jgi:hypothetical protein